MRECIQKILDEVDSEIATLDIDDCDVITNSLAMVTRLENILKELREQVINYTFASKEEEISFLRSKSRKYLVDYSIMIKFIK